MSDCDTCRLLLQAMMDGELDAAGVLRVEEHLKTCSACAQALEDMRLVRGGPGRARRRLRRARSPKAARRHRDQRRGDRSKAE
jgi:predicted anti-sigma-YlaC factor YlaD